MADGTYRTPDFGTLHRLDDEPTYRLWVSGDRCTFVRVWASGLCEIAYRADPSYTWGPPITLTEEKT